MPQPDSTGGNVQFNLKTCFAFEQKKLLPVCGLLKGTLGDAKEMTGNVR